MEEKYRQQGFMQTFKLFELGDDLFCVAQTGFVLKFDKETEQFVPLQNNFSDSDYRPIDPNYEGGFDAIEGVEKIGDNEIWFSTLHGVIAVKIDQENMQVVPINYLLADTHVTYTKKINADEILVGTREQGLKHLRKAGDKYIILKTTDYPYKLVNAIYKDKDKNL